MKNKNKKKEQDSTTQYEEQRVSPAIETAPQWSPLDGKQPPVGMHIPTETGGVYVPTDVELALALNDVNAVREAIAQGWNLDGDVLGEKEWSAIHHAVLNNNIDMVLLLIESGANLHKKTLDGESALDLALQEGYEEIVALLLNLRQTENKAM